MGTRGAFGVIIGEEEKIGYSQFDSYPSGKGVENLNWLRAVIEEGRLDVVRQQALACQLVDEKTPPTPEDIAQLRDFTNLGVSEQSTQDWYCLTRLTQGDIAAMLACNYILDFADFPLDSLFCEWGYIVDFDQNVLEVYEGFQKALPEKGRWAGRPTQKEDEAAYVAHLKWCAANDREPWQPEESEYKAIELIASFPFDALPTDEEFLKLGDREEVEA